MENLKKIEFKMDYKDNLDVPSSYDKPDCIVLTSDDRELKLDRVVLMTRSDVFNAMLSSDMQEGLSGIIKLTEKFSLLTLLFQLMYGMKIKVSLLELRDLIEIMKKYLLMDVHDTCVREMNKFVEPSNCVEMFYYALDNGYDGLRDHAAKIYVRHTPLVLNDPYQWELINENRKIVSELHEIHYQNLIREVNGYKLKQEKEKSVEA